MDAIEITPGETFFEGTHTKWTFVRLTDNGYLFRAQDGTELDFSKSDLPALTRVRGSELAAF